MRCGINIKLKRVQQYETMDNNKLVPSTDMCLTGLGRRMDNSYTHVCGMGVMANKTIKMMELLKRIQVWVLIILGTWLGLNLILFLGPLLLIGGLAVLVSSILVIMLAIIILIRTINYLRK